MIGGQRHLDAIGAELPAGKCRAGVVDENIDARHLAAHVRSQAANCRLGRQVCEKEHRRRTCRNLRDALQRALPRALSLHTLRRAWSFFTDETSPPSAAGQGCGNASTITARLESQAGETEGR